MSVVDVAAVGEVLETFPICASPIQCITSVPGFDDQDPDILAGVCVCVCVRACVHAGGWVYISAYACVGVDVVL